jgi:hypothetical protein
MVAAIVFIAVGIVSLVVFGSLGVGLGQYLEKKGVGTGLAPGCGVIIGVPITGLILWGISKLLETLSK